MQLFCIKKADSILSLKFCRDIPLLVVYWSNKGLVCTYHSPSLEKKQYTVRILRILHKWYRSEQ